MLVEMTLTIASEIVIYFLKKMWVFFIDTSFFPLQYTKIKNNQNQNQNQIIN